MMKIKGITVKSRMGFIEQEFGKDGVRKVLDRLPPEPRAAFSGIIPAFQFFPLEWCDFLDTAICDVFFGGSLEECKTLGAYSAELHRKFYPGNFDDEKPEIPLLNAPRLFKSYYTDNPDTEIIKESDRRYRMVIGGTDKAFRTDCLSNIGYFERALELSGGRNVRSNEIKCRCRDDGECEIEYRWD